MIELNKLDRLVRALAAFNGVPAVVSTDVACAPSTWEPDTLSRARGITQHLADPRWTVNADGKVCDGRDTYLTVLIAGARATGFDTAEAITDRVWPEFARSAELNRPKRDGRQPWRYADALAKARAILRNPRFIPGRASASSDGFWTESRLDAHAASVNAHGAQGRLSPAAVRVSQAMAGYMSGAGTCFASPSTLAAKTGLAERTVKQARARLVAEGLWRVANNRGGRARGADYTPDPRALPEAVAEAFRNELRQGNGDRTAHPKPVSLEITSRGDPRETSPAAPNPEGKKYNRIGTSCFGLALADPNTSSSAHPREHEGDIRQNGREVTYRDGGDA